MVMTSPDGLNSSEKSRLSNLIRVIVGHGPASDRRDAAVLDQQICWLEDYRAARAKDRSAEAVKRVMTAKYLGYANDFIFAFSEMVRKH